jgi:hypothetical protein
MSTSGDNVPGEVRVDLSTAELKLQAPPSDVVASPDPLARAKFVVRTVWPYVAAVVVVLAAIGSVFRHQLQWGDFPTWVMAITTLLAFVAAAFAGLVAYDLLLIETGRDLKAAEERTRADADRREAARRREAAETEREQARLAVAKEQAAQREADRRAQARRVTAWFAYYYKATGDPAPLAVGLPLGSAAWGGVVKNASDLPIFDVRLFYFRVNDPRDGSPWTTAQVYASVDIIRVVPADQARAQELPARVSDLYEGCNDDVYVVGIEFTDADGVRWYRNERAVLEPR